MLKKLPRGDFFYYNKNMRNLKLLFLLFISSFSIFAPPKKDGDFSKEELASLKKYEAAYTQSDPTRDPRPKKRKGLQRKEPKNAQYRVISEEQPKIFENFVEKTHDFSYLQTLAEQANQELLHLRKNSESSFEDYAKCFKKCWDTHAAALDMAESFGSESNENIQKIIDIYKIFFNLYQYASLEYISIADTQDISDILKASNAKNSYNQEKFDEAILKIRTDFQTNVIDRIENFIRFTLANSEFFLECSQKELRDFLGQQEVIRQFLGFPFKENQAEAQPAKATLSPLANAQDAA